MAISSFCVSFLLALVEGKATFYRSAQFLPLFCGYGALLFFYGTRRAGVWGKAACVLALSVILWNQCADTNRWFYVDYLKYENAKSLAGQIANELEMHYDTEKPVIFTGTYRVPESIIGDAYVKYGSETFYRMNRITTKIDAHLLEKYYRPYGVWVAQTPENSVIEWGRYAFGDDSELVKFFAMHGYHIKPLLDTSLYREAELYSLNLPAFPAQGSIADMGRYIIVHF